LRIALDTNHPLFVVFIPAYELGFCLVRAKTFDAVRDMRQENKGKALFCVENINYMRWGDVISVRMEEYYCGRFEGMISGM